MHACNGQHGDRPSHTRVHIRKPCCDLQRATLQLGSNVTAGGWGKPRVKAVTWAVAGSWRMCRAACAGRGAGAPPGSRPCPARATPAPPAASSKVGFGVAVGSSVGVRLEGIPHEQLPCIARHCVHDAITVAITAQAELQLGSHELQTNGCSNGVTAQHSGSAALCATPAARTRWRLRAPPAASGAPQPRLRARARHPDARQGRDSG